MTMRNYLRHTTCGKTYRRFDGDEWVAVPLPTTDPATRPKPQVPWAAFCVAYKKDGSLCGAPARFIDFERGGLVCEEHHKTEVLP